MPFLSHNSKFFSFSRSEFFESLLIPMPSADQYHLACLLIPLASSGLHISCMSSQFPFSGLKPHSSELLSFYRSEASLLCLLIPFASTNKCIYIYIPILPFSGLRPHSSDSLSFSRPQTSCPPPSDSLAIKFARIFSLSSNMKIITHNCWWGRRWWVRRNILG